MVKAKGKQWLERKKCLGHTPSMWSQPWQKDEFYSSLASMKESLWSAQNQKWMVPSRKVEDIVNAYSWQRSDNKHRCLKNRHSSIPLVLIKELTFFVINKIHENLGGRPYYFLCHLFIQQVIIWLPQSYVNEDVELNKTGRIPAFTEQSFSWWERVQTSK